MKYISNIWYYVKRFKYLIILVIGFLYVGIIDSNSWMVRYENKMRQQNIMEEIKMYDEMHARNMKVLDAIGKDPDAMRSIAREKYLMKESDEDIFVLSDDKQEQ